MGVNQSNSVLGVIADLCWRRMYKCLASSAAGGELILLGGGYSLLVQGWAESFAVGSVILGLHGVILSRIWSLAGKRLKNAGNGGKKAKGR